jgi:hypothetical protein
VEGLVSSKVHRWSLSRLSGVAIVWLVLTPAAPVRAQAPDAAAQAVREELARLRQELEALRQQNAALEARMVALEAGKPAPAAAAQPAAPQPAPGAPPTEVAVPAGAAGAGGPAGSLPVYGNQNLFSKIFNPDIAVIGTFAGAAGHNPIEPGPSLAFDEAEATFQAVVDPYARADFFFGFSPEGVEIEEAYLTLTALPGGFLMKVGQVYPQFGKVNTQHTHTLSWVDRPLVARTFFGEEGQFADAGFSVSKLILNPWFFLEATGEVLSGDSAVFESHEADQLTYVGRVRGYQDLTESTNVDLGTSVAYGHNDVGTSYTTTLVGLDATFRYRPLRRAIYRRFLARTELMWSRRGQEDGDAHAFGFYAHGDYQFARRWFTGLRFDYAERPGAPSLADKGVSALLTFWPSEFSQVRGQYRRTRYAGGETGNEFLFQFQFSIGAHGAHVF